MVLVLCTVLCVNTFPQSFLRSSGRCAKSRQCTKAEKRRQKEEWERTRFVWVWPCVQEVLHVCSRSALCVYRVACIALFALISPPSLSVCVPPSTLISPVCLSLAPIHSDIPIWHNVCLFVSPPPSPTPPRPDIPPEGMKADGEIQTENIQDTSEWTEWYEQMNIKRISQWTERYTYMAQLKQMEV